ncbi:MAG TPA: endonuclease/exonuclease/phosphatase family protein [Actinomycetota bacterium]|nr:endonuclease/exonuclease/phosphatase family protein [Actinomycetota bacterium]
MRLRVMVWNVHGFRAGASRMADAAAAEEPDVLIVNETGWFGIRLRRFSRRVAMRPATGLRGFRRIRNAVLVRAPWRIVGRQVIRFPRAGGNRLRGIVLAAVGRAGRRLSVGAVHLGLSAKERTEHVRELTDVLAGHDAVLVGGDLNEGPDGPAVTWIAGRLWDVLKDGGEATFPSRAPTTRIDYLFVSEGVTPERAWTGGERFADLSDHLPVVADLSVD